MPEPTGTIVNPVQVTPKLDPHDTPMCLSHALFLHALPNDLYFLWPIFFALVSAGLTHNIRVVTPGVCKPGAAKPAAKTTAAARRKRTTVENPPVEVDIEAGQVGEAPPPYAPPEPTSVEATPSTAPSAPTKPVVKDSSAYLFVVGTALLIPMLFSLLCLALSIQWLDFCQEASPYSTGWQAWYWILFFCAPAVWATNGVACWAILFRDLWGPAAKKKLPFEETMIIGGIGIVIGCLIAFPIMIVGILLTKAVEAAQRRWCLEALADEDELEIGELGRAGEVEAESQEVSVEGEASEGPGERREETVGLIKGMES